MACGKGVLVVGSSLQKFLRETGECRTGDFRDFHEKMGAHVGVCEVNIREI